MSTNGHFVSLQGVTKRFDDLEVLHGIDLDVGEHDLPSLSNEELGQTVAEAAGDAREDGNPSG